MGERRDPRRAWVLWVIAAKALALALVVADFARDRALVSPLEAPLWIASAGLDFDREVRWEDLGYDDLPVAARVSAREARSKRWVRVLPPDAALLAVASLSQRFKGPDGLYSVRPSPICEACMRAIEREFSRCMDEALRRRGSRFLWSCSARVVPPGGVLMDASVAQLAHQR